MSRVPKVHKFAHHCVPVASKGGLRIQCGCGKQSPVFKNETTIVDGQVVETVTKNQQADAWYHKHTGLKETAPKSREE